VRFYRDVVGFRELTNPTDGGPDSEGSSSGPCGCGIDRGVGVSQAELWLQLTTEDTTAAARHMAAAGVVRAATTSSLCRRGASALWISSPAPIVHLVSTPDPD